MRGWENRLVLNWEKSLLTKPPIKMSGRKENKDRVNLIVPKGTKERIRQAAAPDSVNSFILKAIEDKIKKGPGGIIPRVFNYMPKTTATRCISKSR